MEITKIEINNYKAIKKAISLELKQGYPVCLVGENGSGKTTILEAVNSIFASIFDTKDIYFDFKLFIKLSEAEFRDVFPDKPIDDEGLNVIAYANYNANLKIDAIDNKYIKNVDESTAFAFLERDLFYEKNALIQGSHSILSSPKSFLEWLSEQFETVGLSIDTKGSYVNQQIDRFIPQILESFKKSTPAMPVGFDIERTQAEEEYRRKVDENLPFFKLLKLVYKHLRSIQCLFFKNDNNNTIFKEKKFLGVDVQGILSNQIINKFIQRAYSEHSGKAWSYSGGALDNEVREFLEQRINAIIPDFDRKIVERISINFSDDKLEFVLHEKTGNIVPLNQSSAGRRWYFTFLFLVSLLKPNDVFIIDEAGCNLHPRAQRFVASELQRLSENGINVIYSTHMPYTIPKSLDCIRFAQIDEKNGITIISPETYGDLSSFSIKILGSDIFEIEEAFKIYSSSNQRDLAQRVYKILEKKKGERSWHEVEDELGIPEDTRKSWKPYTNGKKNSKFRCPNLDSLMTIARWANMTLFELIVE
ncbi:MAG: ATP-binding cassette domain-containing protein [Ruminococcaceae bacterium]|nr:ATP-binding cassette domain-containing protein [Oscillospiraceae bacterium]